GSVRRSCHPLVAFQGPGGAVALPLLVVGRLGGLGAEAQAGRRPEALRRQAERRAKESAPRLSSKRRAARVQGGRMPYVWGRRDCPSSEARPASPARLRQRRLRDARSEGVSTRRQAPSRSPRAME